MEDFYRKILKEIKEEFEEINSGVQDFKSKWIKLSLTDLILLEELVKFLKITNGINRIKGDEYFAFKIYPLERFRRYSKMMSILIEENSGEVCSEFKPDDRPSDFIVIGNEGKYGYYALNANPNTPNYGQIYCVIINIPERTGEWNNFKEFFEGLIVYCEEYPLIMYRRDYISCTPNYKK